jgi:hypothetical protein
VKLPAEEFIKRHTHINYCEAVIHKDGDVEYVCPSHALMLIKISGESQDDIDKKIPKDAIPVIWLAEYTGTIAVWSNFYVAPSNVTEEQKKSLTLLIEVGLVEDKNWKG